jgi:hypothetical protein
MPVTRPLINMRVMSSAFVIAEGQIEQVVAILWEGISCTMKDLRKEGVWRR